MVTELQDTASEEPRLTSMVTRKMKRFVLAGGEPDRRRVAGVKSKASASFVGAVDMTISGITQV